MSEIFLFWRTDGEPCYTSDMPIPVSLSSLRQSRGLTQARVGELLGVTDVTIGRWEDGEGGPRPQQLQVLRVAWDMTDGDLAELVASFAPRARETA